MTIEKKHIGIIIGSVAGLAVLLLAFSAGMFIGFHKAEFSFHRGDNYLRTFGERRGRSISGFGMMGMMRGDDYSPSHGAIGRVLKVELPKLFIEDQDQTEKTVLIGSDTLIKHFRDTVSSTVLTANDSVVVIGEPDQTGNIQAKFIRILPPPPPMMGNASSTR